MSQKTIEIDIRGKVLTASNMPEVTMEDGAIVLTFEPGVIVRLCPTLAGKVSQAFGNWQYEMYA